MTDDEPLAHDLSAWEVPDPPADLADSVLARMGATDVAAALPVEEVRPSRKRALVIAGVVAASLAVVAGVYALVRGSEHAGARRGEVIADGAKSLSLGSVKGNLDPGARVRWERRADGLHVEQSAGAAAWRVEAGDTVLIDAGATVASVEASGASLRVEVKVNQTDARLIGASAITAAAVSLVSVIVYEGYVKVGGSHGQPTVIVQPGSTYNVVPPAPPAPPREPRTVSVAHVKRPTRGTVGDLLVVAGDTATIHDLSPPTLVEAYAEGTNCRYAVDGEPQKGGMLFIDEGQHRYTVACDGAAPVEGMLTVVQDDGMRPLLLDDPSGSPLQVTSSLWTDRLKLSGRVVPDTDLSTEPAFAVAMDLADPTIATFDLDASPDSDVFSLRAEHPGRGVHYVVLRKANRTAATMTCDPEALKDKGMEFINAGQHAAALVKFEASLACKDDSYVRTLAYMEACQSRNKPKAQRYYDKLTPAQQAKFKQMCIRNNVDLDDRR